MTQGLDDGATSYTYGLGRISQSSIVNQQSEIAYFLGDALGSVRQLTNSAGEVTFAKAYDPYGNVTQTSGEGQSAYGYTGEQQSNDMLYLRARYYNSANGRFQSRDTWGGDANRPLSYNKFIYGYSNPITYMDPNGKEPCSEALALALAAGGPADPPAVMAGLALCGIYLFIAIGVTRGGFTHNPPVALPGVRELPEMKTLEEILVDCWLVIRPNPKQSPKQEPKTNPTLPPPLYYPTPQPTRDVSEVVYRNPNPSQHPGALTQGFYPKDPSAQSSIEYHVRYGKREGVKTQFISLTRSLSVARSKQQPGLPIYEIDLEKVVGVVYDLTNETVLLATIKNPIARNYARASQEIVLQGWIPPTAILGILP